MGLPRALNILTKAKVLVESGRKYRGSEDLSWKKSVNYRLTSAGRVFRDDYLLTANRLRR